MGTLVRFVRVGKRDCRRSSEGCSLVAHRRTRSKDFYYALAGPEEELRYYKDVELLGSYFVPKVNVPFKRHIFRQMEQQSHGKVDKFVCRLRQKALTCEFSNVDETIRDQLIDKCRDGRLRRKFLEKSNAALKDLQDIGRGREAVDG